MKKVLLVMLISVMASMIAWATPDYENPKNLTVTFNTTDLSGENATVQFGFTKAETNPTDGSSEPTFNLTDNDNNDLTLIGTNSANLYIYWNVLSADKFAIDISSKAMTISGDTTNSTLDFTAKVTPYTNAIAGTSNSAAISKENAYGTTENQQVTVYTHDPSQANAAVGNSGRSAISFETEDAAKKTVAGEWATTVTLTYRSLGETGN